MFNRLMIAVLLLLITTITTDAQTNNPDMEIPDNVNTEIATLGAGCFWCVEAVFQDLKGVYKVESGYMGGHVKNPSYRAVCNGTTGHAEVAQVTFNPDVISFETLLEVFWTTHDPTTLNRQGNDVGPQYRSAIFYHSDEQQGSSLKVEGEVCSQAVEGPNRHRGYRSE